MSPSSLIEGGRRLRGQVCAWLRSLVPAGQLGPALAWLSARTGADPRAEPVMVCLPPAAALVIFIVAFFFLPPSPKPDDSLSTAVFDRNGVLLGASVSRDGQWKFPRGTALPDKFIKALLRFEDRRFYSHPGFDGAAIVRALGQNLRAGHVVSGGSTITMQAARLSLPQSGRTVGRKILELWLALRYEVTLGKRGVLELYAASAPFGGNVVGLEAASFRYFGQPPERLSWAESATLAVLPNSPSAAHPGKNRDLLLAKRDRLLRSLRDAGELSEGELRLALAEPLPPAPYDMPRIAPQLLDRVSADAHAAGMPARRIKTSIEAAVQERTVQILESHHESLALRGIRNAACIVARVDTGEVLAYVGNVGLSEAGDHGQQVDLCVAPRSSGSILKPFLYTAMMDSGELTPRKLVADIPTRIGSYNPENNINAYSGALPAEEALARSLNVPFVRLLRSYGVERFLRLLQGMGMSTVNRSADEYGLTLILGGAEVNLWELAGRYASLARTARGLKADNDSQYFDLVYEPRAKRQARHNPFSRGAAWITLETLLNVQRPGEEASWEDYASSHRIAWKTGTSFGLRDAWAIGVNYDYVVAVWTGNADGQGVPGLRGTDAAAPILFDVFAGLPAGRWFPEPSRDLKNIDVCARSGCLAGPDCAETKSCLVPLNAPAPEPCPYCRLVHLSLDGRYQVDAGSTALSEIRSEKLFILPPTMEWYYKQNHLDYHALPPWKPGTLRGEADSSAIAIISPEAGAQIYVPIEISGEPGATVFSVVDRDASEVVYWHLDGDYLGATRGRHSMEARPGEGMHTLTVVDGQGRMAERHFEILSEK